MKGKRTQLEMDGLATVQAADFHTFPCRVYKETTQSYTVTLPIEVCRQLEISKGDYVQIALRKISEKEALTIFGFSNKGNVAVQVSCPKCHQQGSLHIIGRGTSREYLSVVHRKKHGFSKKEECFIPRSYRDFYRQYLTRKEFCCRMCAHRWLPKKQREKCPECDAPAPHVRVVDSTGKELPK